MIPTNHSEENIFVWCTYYDDKHNAKLPSTLEEATIVKKKNEQKNFNKTSIVSIHKIC